ncbi:MULTISPECIES: transcriptional regulator [unclassified Nodularia (in: cyanobacteria)]|uniref:helix-turn-helix domain-containing transcriptional regulator n=1 Tax=unclassified Nodularia (in: cyanobacteria) TaxID=2656917 RepID=UPI001880D633|nr:MULTISPECIES: transcriptional regulator [unclassified Nodularia (in: cyanobacteria)]MBE9199372.1 transcriptional regulator [Nodularia sp. LEGE 06071]MCC2695094.1 transcriptional regulator [Nodularia sp. LEGE 04288]
MPTSDSYHDYLISRLKDRDYATVYLETHLELAEEEKPDPELLKLALSDVAKALGEPNMTPEQLKLYIKKIDTLLSQPESQPINNFSDWLNTLGLKLPDSKLRQIKHFQMKPSQTGSQTRRKYKI